MDFEKEFRIKPSESVSLKKRETKTKGPFDEKADAVAATEKNIATIQDLQYRMYVEAKQSLLIVLQAPDAAGKDGVIRKVLGKMNPQGCRTYPFKAPSSVELAHDFLWRIHSCTPARGKVAIFNRSHYEDVLAVRVQKLVPESVWRPRYEIINDFERNLAANGTRILKFYLHISPEEQLERFRKRLENPAKHWKLNPGDYEARDQWGEVRRAYEDAFEHCSTKYAPWYVIPADHKWFRDAAISSIVAKTLSEMDPQFPPVEVDLDEIRRLYDLAKDAQKI
ncbi:polyphosphate kinase 2 family protein [Stieleria sp. ICT_E10.1]|uniref:polyphosphate kinase 2 family protein n=1 Tax=Stieleria sedimenti TaxID=2976331 RepID=UPI00218043D4|nr:polyphosphate kinase 2 family protein [Stieleria sedimenti]MCS7471206.1 polyphosphate kinase 2 family protein [Stieleria sedimenti]